MTAEQIDSIVDALERCSGYNLRCDGCVMEGRIFCRCDLLKAALECIREMLRENKEFSCRIEECLKVATTPFMVTTSDEVKKFGPAGPTNSRGSIDVNK